MSLTIHRPMFAAFASRTRQAGVVLVIALIVLVAMMLAAIGLMRSVDTTTLIAGNLAFQQAATHSADAGIEAAIKWLQDNNSGSTLNSDDSTNAYSASGSNPLNNPAAGTSWDQFWMSNLASRAKEVTGSGTDGADGAGNKISYVIDRMCYNAGAKTGGASCVASPSVTASTGNSEEGGEVQLNAPSAVYYRVTVRVAGPKNTVSYVQTMVSM